MKCLHCEKPLGLFARVSRQKFCCSDHEREYQRVQQQLAIELLATANKKVEPETPRKFGAAAARTPASTTLPLPPPPPLKTLQIDVEPRGSEGDAGSLDSPAGSSAARDPFVYRAAQRFDPSEGLGALPPTELRSAPPAPWRTEKKAPSEPIRLLDDDDIVVPASVRRAIHLGPSEAPPAEAVAAPAPEPLPIPTELIPTGEIASWIKVGVWIEGIVTPPPQPFWQSESRPRAFNAVALICHPEELSTQYIAPEEAAKPVDPELASSFPLVVDFLPGLSLTYRDDAGEWKLASKRTELSSAGLTALAPRELRPIGPKSAAIPAQAADQLLRVSEDEARWSKAKPALRRDAVTTPTFRGLSEAPAAAVKRVARATRPALSEAGTEMPRVRLRSLRPTGRRIRPLPPPLRFQPAFPNSIVPTAAAGIRSATLSRQGLRVASLIRLPNLSALPLCPGMQPAAGIADMIPPATGSVSLRRSSPWLRSGSFAKARVELSSLADPSLRSDGTISVPVPLAYHDVEPVPVLTPVTATFSSPVVPQSAAPASKGQPAKARRR